MTQYKSTAKTDSQGTKLDPEGRIEYLHIKAGDILTGRYEVIRELGHGAIGRVFHCRDMVAGREVVLKTVFSNIDQNDMEILRREFEIMNKLHHDDIVSVIDWVEDDFRGYIVMEYVEGETLAAYLEKHRKLEVRIVSDVARQIAVTLDYTHKKQIIHRDVNPNNVILQTTRGKGLSVKLIDFGLSLKIQEDTSYVTCLEKNGTPGYMSPEQINPKYYNGRLTVNSDQYSLAVLVYKMLTGQFPLYNNCDKLTWNTKLNDALNKALASQPEKRFNSCLDFVMAMQTRESFQPYEMISKELLKTLRPKHMKWIGYVLTFAFVLILLFSLLPSKHGISEEELKNRVFIEKEKKAIEAEREQIKVEREMNEEECRKMKLECAKMKKVYSKIKSECVKIEENQKIIVEVKTEIRENEFVGITEGISKKVVTEHESGTVTKEINQQRQEFVIVINGFMYEFIFVPSGTFMMGGAISGNNCNNDEQQHIVTLTQGYWISKKLVTNGQYYSIKKKQQLYTYYKDKPKVGINWTEVKGFCTILTREARKNGQIPEEYEFMLTTESQWEKAVQEGYIFLVEDKCEWCLDMYESYPNQPVSDPIGARGTCHVIRGGAYCYSSGECRIKDRISRRASYRNRKLGFRVVLVPINRQDTIQAENRMSCEN
jgi:formylglycine-generating enzyme required for sulfatase activity